jgi:hypothetical protein
MQKQGILLGSAIIAIGVLALLINLGVIAHLDNLTLGCGLLLVSFLFFRIYHADRQKWWALIPACLCAFLGVVMVVQTFWDFAGELVGAGFLWACTIAFGYIFSRNKQHWWAVIPAGICFTLGSVVLISGFDLLDNDFEAVVFFLGLGLTFVFLWSQRGDGIATDWAMIPAVVMIALALMIYIENVRWLDWEIALPVLLIGVGLFLVTRKSRIRSDKMAGPPFAEDREPE